MLIVLNGIHTHIYIYNHVYIYIYIITCMYIYIYVCVCVYIYGYIINNHIIDYFNQSTWGDRTILNCIRQSLELG